jgi:tetratricopeptide (TPR) repeat protein
MGILHYGRGRLAEAMACFGEKLRTARLLHDRSGLAYAVGSLAMVHADLGDDDLARHSYDEAIDLAGRLDDRRLLAINLANLAGLHKRRGLLDEALSCYDRAIALGEPLGIKFYLADFRYHRADALRLLGRLAEAQADNDRASVLAAELDNPEDRFRCLVQRHQLAVLAASDDTAQARELDGLAALASDAPTDETRAELWYALWELSGAAAHRDKAAGNYRSLASSSPKREYHERLARLEP